MTNSDRKNLRLFLDTADATEWQTWLSTGLFYGVTTNPLLLEKSQITCSVKSLQNLAEGALQLGAKEVQLQTWGTSVEALANTGKRLAEISDRVVVKVPITRAGTQAASLLIADGIRVTLTGVYAVHQVLIAAALGADYAAPYLGRINDLGRNGRGDLVAMQNIITGTDSATRLLVASIRSVGDLEFLATRGLDTFTVSPAIASAFFAVNATERAATDFEAAARRLGAD